MVTFPFIRFALRDAVLLAATAGAWSLDASLRADGTAGTVAIAVAIFTGVLTTVSGFLCHEWGHLFGTWLGGGVAHAPKRLASVFLFFFDVERSSRRSFLSMSWGGYVASAVAGALIAALVPWQALSGRVALGLTFVGVAVTFALEVPTTLRVARGGRLPQGGVFIGEPPT